MTTQEIIDQFVSDAAYRVGEIGMKMDQLADQSNHEYYHLKEMRSELSMFLSILRHTTLSIIDASNFLKWEDYDILKECEYQRRNSEMNLLPIIAFTNHAVPVLFIESSSSGNSGSALPEGSPGNTIFYNASNEAYAEDISPYAGAGNDDINTYFAGRP